MFKLLAIATSAILLAIPVFAESPQASGELNCKQSRSQPYFPCPFVVKRTGAGAATLDITFPDGTVRTITWKDSKIFSTNAKEKFAVEMEGDLATVRIGTESYEIVDAIPYGG